MNETTEILEDVCAGNRAKIDRLSELVYVELRQMAANFLRREKASHNLQPTALVHEAFLRLISQDRVTWKGRSHFLAVGLKRCVAFWLIRQGAISDKNAAVAVNGSNSPPILPLAKSRIWT